MKFEVGKLYMSDGRYSFVIYPEEAIAIECMILRYTSLTNRRTAMLLSQHWGKPFYCVDGEFPIFVLRNGIDDDRIVEILYGDKRGWLVQHSDLVFELV